MEVRLKTPNEFSPATVHRLTQSVLIAFSSLAWYSCGSNEPTDFTIVYRVVYSLAVEGVQSEVTDIHWTAHDGTENLVSNPPAGWALELTAFSGDQVGLRLEGRVSNGEIRIRLSATSPGVTGISGDDSCSEDAGIPTSCALLLSQVTLP